MSILIHLIRNDIKTLKRKFLGEPLFLFWLVFAFLFFLSYFRILDTTYEKYLNVDKVLLIQHSNFVFLSSLLFTLVWGGFVLHRGVYRENDTLFWSFPLTDSNKLIYLLLRFFVANLLIQAFPVLYFIMLCRVMHDIHNTIEIISSLLLFNLCATLTLHTTYVRYVQSKFMKMLLSASDVLFFLVSILWMGTFNKLSVALPYNISIFANRITGFLIVASVLFIGFTFFYKCDFIKLTELKSQKIRFVGLFWKVNNALKHLKVVQYVFISKELLVDLRIKKWKIQLNAILTLLFLPLFVYLLYIFSNSFTSIDYFEFIKTNKKEMFWFLCIFWISGFLMCSEVISLKKLSLIKSFPLSSTTYIDLQLRYKFICDFIQCTLMAIVFLILLWLNNLFLSERTVFLCVTIWAILLLVSIFDGIYQFMLLEPIKNQAISAKFNYRLSYILSFITVVIIVIFGFCNILVYGINKWILGISLPISMGICFLVAKGLLNLAVQRLDRIEV
ncbi:MAG: hypothetical protein PHE49_08570 [bacterium]|nr:hypothetical protein [bacterium]